MFLKRNRIIAYNMRELYKRGRLQLKGLTNLHAVYPSSVAPKCFSLGDFCRHLFSKSGYGSQESVFLEALQWFICMATFRKYYFKWSHHTLKLFLWCIKSIKHPWRSYLKFALVFQCSDKAQKLCYFTGGIFWVRRKKIRHLSHTLWLLIPVPILIVIFNNTTA